jgi:transcriptional regulator GlxA family with amidase domain
MDTWSALPGHPNSGRIASMQKKSARNTKTVAAVVLNGVAPFELAVACEVFGIDRSYLVAPWYRFVVCAAEPPPIRTSVGFTIDTPHGLEGLRQADLIVVPPGQGEHETPPPALLEELRRAHDRGARILSVCTGAFILAAAGLLDGRPATTHWAHAAELARRYPKIKLDPGVLYVDDGDILTSAGTAAGIDLCLHIVRQDHGAEVANGVARRMVVPPHRDGGQAQFVDQPVPNFPDCDPLTETLVWVEQHLDKPVSVKDLAARSAMSPRTFARRFRATTGTTPHQWLVQQRVLLAQRLLETTDLTVDLIASRCGLGTATNLRQHFQRMFRTTPNAYRRTFQTAKEAS